MSDSAEEWALQILKQVIAALGLLSAQLRAHEERKRLTVGRLPEDLRRICCSEPPWARTRMMLGWKAAISQHIEWAMEERTSRATVSFTPILLRSFDDC